MNRREFLRSLAVSLGVVAGAGSIAALAKPAPVDGALTREAFDRFVKGLVPYPNQTPLLWCHPRHKAGLVARGVPERFIECYQRPP